MPKRIKVSSFLYLYIAEQKVTESFKKKKSVLRFKVTVVWKGMGYFAFWLLYSNNHLRFELCGSLVVYTVNSYQCMLWIEHCKRRSLAGLKLGELLWKQVGGRKFSEFTVQPILSNIKVANWQIKVWRISSIRQIRQTKVPPNFCLLELLKCSACEHRTVIVYLSISYHLQFRCSQIAVFHILMYIDKTIMRHASNCRVIYFQARHHLPKINSMTLYFFINRT